MAKVCCYDNPETMTREAHVDGKIRMGITATMLAILPADFVMPLELNQGPWNPGQMIGDPQAINHGWGKAREGINEGR